MTRIRNLTLLTALTVGVFGFCGTECYAQASASTEVPIEVLRLLNDEDAAWAKGDADAFAAHVRDNVAFTNIVGMFSVGKVPFVAQHKSIFATIYKGSSVRQFVQNITYVGSDTAIVDTIAKLIDYKEIPTGSAAVDGALYTRLEQVMVKEAGTWKVASFHNVSIAPKYVDESVRSLTAGVGH